MINQAQLNYLVETTNPTEKLAKVMVDHVTNEKGEILARVWENPGFQEVYDYKGVLKERRRLKRKQEQVFNQLDVTTQLFQKVYYHPSLLLDDEIALRSEFIRQNDASDRTIQYARGALFLAYWPLTYVISRQVRPISVFLWTASYYAAYRVGALGWLTCSLQSSLNKSAEPFAQKYGVKRVEDYLKQ